MGKYVINYELYFLKLSGLLHFLCDNIIGCVFMCTLTLKQNKV